MGSQRMSSASGKQTSGSRYGITTSASLTQRHKNNVGLLHEEWEKVNIEWKKDEKVPGVVQYVDKESTQNMEEFRPFDLEKLVEQKRQQQQTAS